MPCTEPMMQRDTDCALHPPRRLASVVPGSGGDAVVLYRAPALSRATPVEASSRGRARGLRDAVRARRARVVSNWCSNDELLATAAEDLRRSLQRGHRRDVFFGWGSGRCRRRDRRRRVRPPGDAHPGVDLHALQHRARVHGRALCGDYAHAGGRRGPGQPGSSRELRLREQVRAGALHPVSKQVHSDDMHFGGGRRGALHLEMHSTGEQPVGVAPAGRLPVERAVRALLRPAHRSGYRCVSPRL